MPLIGRIRDEATSTLTEAKMIKSERGPVELKKMVDKLLKKAAKADKQELARMSTYEIFTTFVYLLNSDNFSYEETMFTADMQFDILPVLLSLILPTFDFDATMSPLIVRFLMVPELYLKKPLIPL